MNEHFRYFLSFPQVSFIRSVERRSVLLSISDCEFSTDIIMSLSREKEKKAGEKEFAERKSNGLAYAPARNRLSLIRASRGGDRSDME
jgi:hypothetical protein